ncbi:MAG: methionyl-tRNA formyltransferase [Kangiellaceae bacterium]|nr:methionyl-tRNA formyltransferase [Kangiellaceae bacterium]
MTQPLKIVFAGTPDFSASVLDSLLDNGHKVSAVYCQPDRHVGRGKKLSFGPVKKLAVEHQIPVEQPLKFDNSIGDNGLTPLQQLESYQADLMIVVAYGLILPIDVLEAPKYGCVNIHASILPRWRGAAPIQRAIQAGDRETGITIMQMDEGLDTGNMLVKQTCSILSDDTGASLHDRLAEIGATSINQFLKSFTIESGSELFPGEQQDNNEACYAHKMNKAEAEIDWQNDAVVIERNIRAFNAWPVSFTHVGNQRLRVWQANLVDLSLAEFTHLRNNKVKFDEDQIAAGDIVEINKTQIIICCGDGQVIALVHLQADGSRAMSVAEMLNSKRSWFTENRYLGRKNSPAS